MRAVVSGVRKHSDRIFVIAFSMILLLAIVRCVWPTRTHKLLVPKGYVGWIRVEFGVPGAPLLPREDGLYVMRIPPSGRLRTSMPYPDRLVAALEVYPKVRFLSSLRQPKEKPMAWIGSEWGTAPGLVCFLGTKRQYDALAIKTLNGRRVGPIDPRWVSETTQVSPSTIEGADLRRRNLGGANLLQRDLSHAHLDGANLAGAGLIDSNLNGARLREANLSQADLFEARLVGADLTSANMEGTKLEGADLTGATLTRARLRGAVYDHATLWPKGFRPERHGAVRVLNQPGHSSLRVLLPRGFVGPVRVDYDVAAAPPLTQEPDGYYLLKGLNDGCLKTSSPNNFDRGRRWEFCFHDDRGKRRKLNPDFRARFTGGGSGHNSNYDTFEIAAYVSVPPVSFPRSAAPPAPRED
jgi:hypothetical protein